MAGIGHKSIFRRASLLYHKGLVQATYALRWQIELLFKELKRHCRLEDRPSRVLSKDLQFKLNLSWASADPKK